MYRDGKGVEVDLEKAADLMRCVVNKNTKWQHELLEILWKRGTMESNEEVRYIVESLSNNGDAEAMVRLSRMYRHGKGIEKNQDKAIEWLEKAVKKDSKWELELVDNLLETNSLDNHIKAYGICIPLAELGDSRAAEGIGRIYRDGKGVNKNIDNAIKYMRVASEGGIQQARNALVSMLLNRGKDDDLKEALGIASDFLKYENPGLAVHLSRMYRDGKGVEKSINYAIKYMAIATSLGHLVAKKELIDLLLQRKYNCDPELALAINNLVNSSSESALYKAACIVRDHGGNIDEALIYMTKAANAGSEDAKSDLFYLQQAKSEWSNNVPSYYTIKNYKFSKYAYLTKLCNPSNPMRFLGWNTGNLGFRSAIEKLFRPDLIAPEFIGKDLLKRYDALIIADLIYIRENADFSYLEKRLEGVDIPIVPMSVGIQSIGNKDDFKLHGSVIRLLKKIQEKSVIGVRGEYTESVLNNNGIYNTQVIGCPSMYFWNDREFKVEGRQCEIKTIGNFRTFSKDKPLTRKEVEFIRFLRKESALFVEQTKESLEPNLLGDVEDAANLCDYIKDKGEYYYTNKEWIDAIGDFDFSIGLRFHGNVMGLRAGLKSLFITSDSRTKELTSFFNLPSININDFDGKRPLLDYYELADYSKFNREYSKKFDNFVDFVHKNGMKIMDK